MKKIRLVAAITLLLLAFSPKLSAQFYFFDNEHYDTHLLFEAGGTVGAMNCLSDIGGRKGKGAPFLKDLNTGNTHLNGGFYLSAIYKYAVALRLEGIVGRVSAYDSILKDVEKTTEGRYQRNLNFRSNISEVSLVAEFHIRFILRSFLFEDDLNVDDEPPRLSPYFAAGIGFYSFNPQGKVGNNWIDLQPLSLEGQGFAEYPNRKPYKLAQFNLIVGGGLKYELTSNISLRTELLYRTLSTDYLDDVSWRYINRNLFQKYFTGKQLQNALDLSSNDRVNPGGPTGVYRKTEGGRRGVTTNNDAYFTLNFKVGYVFGRERIIRHRQPRRF
ncbi:MAG: hypothetical protein ABIN94_11935 [Ferruginibacter sp.]